MSDMTAEVPFVQIGNRRGLTARQVMEDPWLADFVKRFPDSFEVAIDVDAVLFIEPPLDKSPAACDSTGPT